MNTLQHGYDAQRSERHPLQIYIIWDTEIERVTAVITETSPQHALASDQFAQNAQEQNPDNWHTCDPDLPTARAIVYSVPPHSSFRPRQADVNRLSHTNLSNHADHVGAFVCHPDESCDIEHDPEREFPPISATPADEHLDQSRMRRDLEAYQGALLDEEQANRADQGRLQQHAEDFQAILAGQDPVERQFEDGET